MRKAERALKYSDLRWTPEAMAAYDRYIEATEASFRRALSAANTPEAPQAEFEEEAIHQLAMKKYTESMRRIAHKYPGVPGCP